MSTETTTQRQQNEVSSAFLGDIGKAKEQGAYMSGQSSAAYNANQLLDYNNAFLRQAYELYGGAAPNFNQDYGINSDYNTIYNNNQNAINAAYNQQAIEGRQNLNTVNAGQARAQASNMAALRNNLMTSALNGANAGQVNANILSAYLANQATNAENQTAALQNLQNIAEQRRAALAKNASASLETANAAAASKGSLQNSEAANRAGIISNAYYGNGNLTPNIANQTNATEYGNIANANLSAQGGKTTTTSTTRVTR